MSDQNSPKRTLEPGTLDKTRKNIGPIDDAEAIAMQKILGGEILKEKAAPIDYSKMPKNRNRREAVVRASGKMSSDVSNESASFGSSSSSAFVGGRPSGGKKVKTDEGLPEISARELKLMDRCMMSAAYNIKPDFGFFNFLFRMSAKNKEKVQKNLGDYVIKRHVDHIQAFVTTIKTFIQISPDAYKAKIATETDLKFKFLRTIGKWQIKDLKNLAFEVEDAAEILTVPMLIPIVRSMYRLLLTVYYIGDQQVSALIREIYTDLGTYPNSDKVRLQSLAKQGLTEWLYLHDQIIKGFYPLLMRMCSTEYVEFPDFFKVKIADILKFLSISKFDLLLPEKRKPEEKKNAEKKEEKKKEPRKIIGEKNEVVNMGLKILEQLFPEAGFLHLDDHPDLYPYFQPIYNFVDGFNVIHPENPLQVTIVLILIIEDLFKGCRNIKFNIEADEVLGAIPDKLDVVMNDWISYYEDLFGKKIGDYLRTYVNTLYSQRDYAQTNFGKENLNNILWRMRYFFLPNFKFNAPVLQKPINDTKYKPFYGRTDYVRTVFATLTRRIDENAAGKKTVLGVMNPWEKYSFELPNPVSKRIDVLLGAKRDASVSAATNANLIKYTYCIMSVLDWWVNNPASPAYTSSDSIKLYRVNPADGAPQFSVELRTNQNQLFADGVKKAIEARKNK
ncbi:MAG: hypothetical protein SPJ89_08840 [Treponema sp.]|nr:hypothetical protein [Spirochaetales bacterium]MDY5812070.1 hypothetical protein [Treponema sp.]